MLIRRSKNRVFMEIAESLSQLGTCDRKQVGAVIVRDGRCISWGYNGAPPGLPHCGENNHGWDEIAKPRGATGGADKKKWAKWQAQEQGCRNATHAEANALAFAAKEGISTAGGTLYVTLSPCETCARLLIAAGIEHVYCVEVYRDRAGLELIERALIPITLIG